MEKNKGNESIKVSIDIPEEFVKDFNTNRFQEFFERVLSDMNGQGLCGKYERETAEMFCQHSRMRRQFKAIQKIWKKCSNQ